MMRVRMEKWIVQCVVAVLAILTLLQPHSAWARHKHPFFGQTSSADTARMAEVDDGLGKMVMFRAVKRAYPVQWGKFRQELLVRIKAGATNKELVNYSLGYYSHFLDVSLSHATPATIKTYLTSRQKMFQGVYAISPDILFSGLLTGQFGVDTMDETQRTALAVVQNRFYNEVAPIITASPSKIPLKQDNSLVAIRLTAIKSRLSPDQLKAYPNAPTSSSDRAAVCRNTIHLYKEILKLPDVEVVQIFRYLRDIPKDDRSAN